MRARTDGTPRSSFRLLSNPLDGLVQFDLQAGEVRVLEPWGKKGVV